LDTEKRQTNAFFSRTHHQSLQNTATTMNIRADITTKPRLDVFLSSQLPELTRSKIQALLKSGDITVNTQPCKPKYTVLAGDQIQINIPQKQPEEAQPEDIPLQILHEDEHIIVINKSSGIVVHPAAGNQSGTLVNALLHHCKGQLASEGGSERPGIVHRLDKDTSGCIIIAKTNLAHIELVRQFKERETKKQYLTVVQGTPNKSQERIFTNIGRHPINRLKMAVVNPGTGKSAITDYQVLGTLSDSNTSLILCDLHTGRTHQIRVHMVHIGTPIIADPIYAKAARQKVQTGRLMLHAYKLTITHPKTQKSMQFTAPIPAEYAPWTDKFHTQES